MFKKRMTIIHCEEAFRSQSKTTGGEYAMYDIKALDEGGAPISERLRSFEPMPVGELREYEVHPYDNEQFGRSYTLKLPKAGSRLGPKVDALREEVDELKAENKKLAGRIAALESRMSPMAPASADGHEQGSERSESSDSGPEESVAGAPPPDGPPEF
jgi:hypothetical protein